ncbi:hypothetical protein OG596_26460 [Streptomyces sp. NBC_01102]|uniref:hypothetical protein n=1 Tax=Streptomyces sp. NBC_01102 TaxID=2903749 RepID=UPI0038697505|nr:hypothetical protein OG596_26460 [Streptomyces sp. NBC_01102]
MTNRSAQDEAQAAIFSKIKQITEQVSEDHEPKYASETLKNLAEAYAWTAYPNQPH